MEQRTYMNNFKSDRIFTKQDNFIKVTFGIFFDQNSESYHQSTLSIIFITANQTTSVKSF